MSRIIEKSGFLRLFVIKLFGKCKVTTINENVVTSKQKI